MVCHGEFDLLFDADRLCPECKKRQMEKAGHTINGNITTDKRFGMFGLHGVENVRSELYVALENAVNYSDSPVFSNFREKPRHTKFCFFESQHDGRVKEILRNYYCVDFGVERLPGIANCSYFCEYGKATLPTRVGGVGVEYFSRLCDKERLLIEHGIGDGAACFFEGGHQRCSCIGDGTVEAVEAFLGTVQLGGILGGGAALIDQVDHGNEDKLQAHRGAAGCVFKLRCAGEDLVQKLAVVEFRHISFSLCRV